MNVIELTHTIQGDMPVYPGTEQPVLTTACTIRDAGYRETILHMYSHTGTHMDAPAHMIELGRTLDAFPAETFVGPGFVLDCRGLAEIPLSLLRAHESEIPPSGFPALLHRLGQALGPGGLLRGLPLPNTGGGGLCGRAPSQGHRRGLHLHRPLRQHRFSQSHNAPGRRPCEHGEPEEFRPAAGQIFPLCCFTVEIRKLRRLLLPRRGHGGVMAEKSRPPAQPEALILNYTSIFP